MLPICPVELVGPRKRVGLSALVDSGAVYSVFPQKAAEDAGIPLPKYGNTTLQYGGSSVEARKIGVYLYFADLKINTEVMFVERLGFSYALLGRFGFFSRFNEVVFAEKISAPKVEFRW